MDQKQSLGGATVAQRLVTAGLGSQVHAVGADVMLRARMCLMDYLSCALEARDLPWSAQAASLAVRQDGHGAHIVGRSGRFVPADAAFANAVAGHGLVREDMHAGSVAHLGVVVWPTLMALAERTPVAGRDLLHAAIVGYEAGAVLGRAVMTESLARLFRPTGLVGPYAAALAGARLLSLDAQTASHAFALAGNCSAGLNEWPHTGGSEMYFHPGFVVRNAMTCLELAVRGATGSASILEGEAGFSAAYARAPLATDLTLFAGSQPEIMAVFNKAVPACNFAQSPCQAALDLVPQLQGRRVRKIQIDTTRAAVAYPGCAARGPFSRALQAKMSIAFGVAAVLARGEVAEANYARLDDPEIHRLLQITTLSEDAGYTAAFPARQGARVTLQLEDGAELSASLDDVRAADDVLIRARFTAAATAALGAAAARRLTACVDGLAQSEDAGEVARQCAAPSPAGTKTFVRAH